MKVSCRTGGDGRPAVSVPLCAILADVGQRTPQTPWPARPLPGLVDSGPRAHIIHTGQDTHDLRRRCAGDATPRARPPWSRDPHDPVVALAGETRRECQGMTMEGMIGPRPPLVRHGHDFLPIKGGSSLLSSASSAVLAGKNDVAGKKCPEALLVFFSPCPRVSRQCRVPASSAFAAMHAIQSRLLA